MPFSKFFERKRRLRAYLKARQELDLISDRDLADMGIKRYELEAATYTNTLG
jgi:uncharacterized protein YjiS (DUF1127 family)